MNELSLFTGCGIGSWAFRKTHNWKTIGYVEWDDYCQRVITQRIKDGHLERAPIFGDIKTFTSEGYSKRYQGMVDVITAGFPCQPFSVAGKQQANNDKRNMWPATIETIRIIKPTYCFLENVPGLLSRSHRYFETILKDLAESGYDARWKVISAAEVGAPHRRDRLWIVANAKCIRSQRQRKYQPPSNSTQNPYREADRLVDAVREGTLPFVCRRHERVGHGVDRIKALGNGWVTQCAIKAWEILTT